MLWRHDPDPWDVNQAPQLGESAKAPSKASPRPPFRHFQTLRPITRLRQAARFWAHGERVGLVPKLVWRVKLVAELRPGVMTETEVARIERDEQAGLADLGLRLAETKQLTAALQAEIVPAQIAVIGERRRCCSSCGHKLASKGHYPVTFRSLFGDVPVRVRRRANA
jgi:hypothetical protein